MELQTPTKESIVRKLFVAKQVWIDYKGLSIITDWKTTKSSQVFNQLKKEANCINPFDSRRAKTEVILERLGYSKDKLVKDLESDLEVLNHLNGGDESGKS